ncbi:persephin [Cuculus canorus]|uniref:persephin n=1 Tax=Cuculus canorus TaxID=55661 RepID=UPI0023AA3806|nr:persephin [Cuculus canorus]
MVPSAFLLLLLLLGPPRVLGGPPSPPSGPPLPCGLRSIAVRVRELGLGFGSEETLLFRYCGGGCPAPPTNHRLALARIGGAPGGAAGGPCCRPSRFEDVAFLDEKQRWQRVPQLSAAACQCLG